MATITTDMKITDATLLNFHNQRHIAYTGTKKRIDEELPLLQKSIPEIESFSTQVRAKGKAYQEALEPTEMTEAMVTELKDFLQTYQNFKSTYEKTTLVTENIMGTIAFLTPMQRQWAAEKALEADTPELYAQAKESEKICLEFIAKLKPLLAETVALKDKLFVLINNTTLTWSIQRFCGIVANDGKPLSSCTRFVNYVSPYLVTPTIPKPDEIKMPQQQANSTTDEDPFMNDESMF